MSNKARAQRRAMMEPIPSHTNATANPAAAVSVTNPQPASTGGPTGAQRAGSRGKGRGAPSAAIHVPVAAKYFGTPDEEEPAPLPVSMDIKVGVMG